MSMGILGKKLGMAQIYNEQGQAVPVTIIQAGPCPVVDMKTPEKDGYSALVLGFGSVNKRKLNKSRKGLFEKSDVEPVNTLREFRLDSVEDYSVGQEILVSLFTEGEMVHIAGVSKGKGFAGVMKKYHFGGSNASHGASVVHRRGGSSGASSYPGRVFKNKKMPGRMGGEKVTVKNLAVVAVDTDNNLLLVKGAVPGAKNSLVTLYKKG
ncbi:50S ribosomal protein L3 [Aminivibrio sp.]